MDSIRRMMREIGLHNFVMLSPVNAPLRPPQLHDAEDMHADANGDIVEKLKHTHISFLQEMAAGEIHPPCCANLRVHGFGSLPDSLASCRHLVAHQRHFSLRCR